MFSNFFDFTGVVNKSDYFHLRAAFFANQGVDLVDFLDPNTPLAGDGLFINACRINRHSKGATGANSSALLWCSIDKRTISAVSCRRDCRDVIEIAGKLSYEHVIRFGPGVR